MIAVDAFCKPEEYMQRYGDVDNIDVLTECLGDASAVIAAELDARGIDYTEPSDEYADRLMRVCRSMTNRIMPSAESSWIPVGASQVSQTAGSYNRQITFGGVYGTPKLLDSEKRLLGIASSGIGWARLGGYDTEEPNV